MHLGPDDGSKSPILLGFGAAGAIRLGPVSGQSLEALKLGRAGWIASGVRIENLVQ
jgi:hypothetical protein